MRANEARESAEKYLREIQKSESVVSQLITEIASVSEKGKFSVWFSYPDKNDIEWDSAVQKMKDLGYRFEVHSSSCEQYVQGWISW